ncbi:MAG: hypothetical protein R3346_00985 [Candidatus Spechtbacterales bacterium]|nr:hypothetical protein [Candidatus Spechtbacterales bacterium]
MVKISNKNKWIIFIGIIILFVVLFLSLATKNANPKKEIVGLIEKKGAPIEEWPRIITVEELNGKKIVKNTYDKYKISIPDEAVVYTEQSRGTLPLEIFKAEEHEPRGDFPAVFNGYALRIYTFENPKNMDVINWIANSSEARGHFTQKHTFEAFSVGENRAFKASYNLFDTEDILVWDYVIKNESNIYVLSCMSFALNPEVYVEDCEQDIQSFDVL